ncbi:hypothetical protein HDU96_004698 [Phlyctochytrium bullatum]|nr:hypothetical protein HDU96_004698 [Phlyctochytrium bullatum]
MAVCCCCKEPYVVPSPFDQAVIKLMADLNAEFGETLQGIFLAGSVATNNINVMSDLDLFVIHKDMKRQRRLFRVAIHRPENENLITRVERSSNGNKRHSFPSDYVNAEVFINPASRMLEEIKRLEDPTVNAWRQGHVLQDDAEQTVHRIKDVAQEIHRQRKPGWETWTPFQVAMRKYELVDQLHDAWDTIEAGDAASGSLMLARGLSMSLDLLYDSQGWWRVKEKRRLRDLMERSLSGEPMARRVLQLSKRIARGDLELVERHASLKELIDVVLEPLGGVLVTWKTEWEPNVLQQAKVAGAVDEDTFGAIKSSFTATSFSMCLYYEVRKFRGEKQRNWMELAHVIQTGVLVYREACALEDCVDGNSNKSKSRNARRRAAAKKPEFKQGSSAAPQNSAFQFAGEKNDEKSDQKRSGLKHERSTAVQQKPARAELNSVVPSQTKFKFHATSERSGNKSVDATKKKEMGSGVAAVQAIKAKVIKSPDVSVDFSGFLGIAGLQDHVSGKSAITKPQVKDIGIDLAKLKFPPASFFGQAPGSCNVRSTKDVGTKFEKSNAIRDLKPCASDLVSDDKSGDPPKDQVFKELKGSQAPTLVIEADPIVVRAVRDLGGHSSGEVSAADLYAEPGEHLRSVTGAEEKLSGGQLAELENKSSSNVISPEDLLYENSNSHEDRGSNKSGSMTALMNATEKDTDCSDLTNASQNGEVHSGNSVCEVDWKSEISNSTASVKQLNGEDSQNFFKTFGASVDDTAGKKDTLLNSLIARFGSPIEGAINLLKQIPAVISSTSEFVRALAMGVLQVYLHKFKLIQSELNDVFFIVTLILSGFAR